jgi:hypothetical protein
MVIHYPTIGVGDHSLFLFNLLFGTPFALGNRRNPLLPNDLRRIFARQIDVSPYVV